MRVVKIDGEPWFVAKEVWEAFGLTHVTNAVAALAEDERRVALRSTNRNLFTDGRGSSRLVLISEPGLYKLVGGSSKPAAKEFDRWIRHTVLPSIRKDGSYVRDEQHVVSGAMTAPLMHEVNSPSSLRLIPGLLQLDSWDIWHNAAVRSILATIAADDCDNCWVRRCL